MQLALGQTTDRRLSAWESTFIPGELQLQLRRIRVPGSKEVWAPLVRSERILQQGPPPPSRASDRIAWNMVIGILVGLALAALGAFSHHSTSPVARSVLGVAGASWGLLSGALGLVILGLWGLTDHVATYSNENVFQVNPLSLILVVSAPMAASTRLHSISLFRRLSLLPAALGGCGAIAQVFPYFDQSNGDIIALVLPIYGALAWALWRASDRPVC